MRSQISFFGELILQKACNFGKHLDIIICGSETLVLIVPECYNIIDRVLGVQVKKRSMLRRLKMLK